MEEGPERLPAISADQMTDAQRAAAAEFAAIRGTDVFGPFAVMLRSPELMLRSAALGEYVRYRSALSQPLSELAILITAHHWRQPYQWAVHAPIAVAAGVRDDIVRAIADGQRPDRMSDDQACVHDLLVELHQTQRVRDETYARTVTQLGEQGLVDLLGIAGHYTFLSMVMNTARTAVPRIE